MDKIESYTGFYFLALKSIASDEVIEGDYLRAHNLI